MATDDTWGAFAALLRDGNKNNKSSSIGDLSQDVMMDSGSTSNLAFHLNHHAPKTSTPQPKDRFVPQPAHEQQMKQKRTYEPPAMRSQL